MGVEAAAAGPPCPYPLRGRDGELTSLHDHLARLRSGAGTSWLIEGAPGLGKSRLIEQAMSAARESGFAVGHGCGRAWRCGR